ncbi:hypothetical protein G9C85_16655 [Halorubellus sp. JP-L1]|uniref:hypothetical protein n=1 Tax=Halorubellus sp. JP-L1 TaxID=2715753 RepID=UPI001408A176|nr:hypothetical protein [Halorubellus sp. JP-L1]NHN43249.1 hypothetical protein [Halorubellus sp. JP-L1]
MAEPGLTEALAAALGVAFGALMVAYPGVVLAVQTAGTRPDRQPGPGGDAPTDDGVWETLIRVVGVGFVLAGVYFASLFVV